ncbi:YceI-like domain protein [Mariniflexile rhizosphaerae]|uniref:YceI family protein n=1 Tax=unclassified Mariniflexile TaxID=2643887 RepID=UPI000CB132A3|nr:YceI family protein [Mariniflexile sp. TRM1-10]AXP79462.1 YceI-like domain protein [Mariniflexile sp. TRM1-10]PLB19416.1 MAG: YceI-like protein [Flavobacteriaceae bacterium FS1-H7996/R]
MKKLVYIIVLISMNAFSQTKFITKSGIVNFEASVPSFEEVAAKNNSATAILNTENGEFAALVLVKGFRFKNALMEEHFNENYAESDKYPKATFKGKIDGFLINKLSDKPSVFYLNGALTFHGKTKTLEKVAVSISKKEGQINITGHFTEKASSFDIKIPKIVSSKIANDIEVTFEFLLKSK